MGQKKLFLVTVETEIAVVAEDRDEAERTALDNIRHEVEYNSNYSSYAMEINDEKQLFRPWAEAIPYGECDEPFDDENPDMTCAEILAAIKDRDAAKAAVAAQPVIEGLDAEMLLPYGPDFESLR